MLSCGLNLKKASPPLVVEHFDLMQVWRPFLIVKGLEFEEEDEISDELIKDEFESLAGGAKIESIKLNGTEAKISFLHPPGIVMKI